MGELTLAHAHFEQAAINIDPPRQRNITELYGMDVAAGCSGYAAFPLWMMGYPTRLFGGPYVRYRWPRNGTI